MAPSNATNKEIVWSVKDAGDTKATISGNTLKAEKVGKVTLLATIKNGLASDKDFTKEFVITISNLGFDVEPNNTFAKGDVLSPDLGNVKGSLSKEDKEAVEADKEVKVLLRMDKKTDTTSAETELIQSAAQSKGFDNPFFLDVSLYTVRDGNFGNYIVKSDVITIKVKIPDEIKENNRNYDVVRLHDGNATLLNAKQENGILTFQTGLFSTYAIVSKEATTSNGSAHHFSGGSGFGAYWITASAGSNGTISPAGETKVTALSNLTYKVLPNDGYVVDKVLIDGSKEVSLVNDEYTFTSINAPYTIHATFKKAAGTAVEAPASTVISTPAAPNPATGDSWFSHLFDVLTF